MNGESGIVQLPATIFVGVEQETSLSGIVDKMSDLNYRIMRYSSLDEMMGSVDAEQPKLFLLETGWDGMNPLKSCKKITTGKATATIPVILLLTAAGKIKPAEALKAGAADVLSEPFDEDEIVWRIKNQLDNHLLQQELLQANEKNHKEKQRLRITLHSIGDGVACTDQKGMITLINQVAQDLTGWDEASAIGRPFTDIFTILNEKTREHQPNPVEIVLQTGKVVELSNHSIIVSRSGNEHPITDNAAPIRDDKGNTVGAVLVFRDVTDEKKYLSEIEYLSFHDPLTGLYNRRYYLEELNRLDTSRRLPLTLVMGDVNGLKLTNDSFGHEAGDQLIKRTADILKQSFRTDDILCRYGGDEFVAILPNTDPMMAESIIRRIQHRIEENQPANGILSVSFGLDTKTSEDQPILEVFKNAEDNMYKTKMVESPSVRNATIHAVINTLFEKNSREEAHSKRVSDLATRLAAALNLPSVQIDKVRTAALMHDIGKIVVPDGVLDSPNHLSDGEWGDIKKHPETGYRILNCTPEMAEISNTILQHHERWDGTGYPSGIKGKEIDLCARIIAIADTYDAMTSARPYRDALDPEVALQEISDNAGIQFDPDVAKEFVKMCSWDICLEKFKRRG
jgi:diguanylate cyclase